MDIRTSLKTMLILSALFHAGLLVLLPAVSLNRSTHPFAPQVYRVDLVTFPSAPSPPAAVTAAPAEPPPPAQKPPIKEKKPPKETVHSKIEIKKPPAQPPKPIRPAAVVPPSVTSRETVPPKQTAPAIAKPLDDVAAIPSPAAKIEAGIEASDFKSPYYLNLIQRKIELYWLPPPLEPTSEIKEAVVGFVLFASGRIKDPTIEKSSGNAFFDQAALRAIYQANPLPPFPQGIRDPSLKVHFSFSLMKKS